LRRILMLLKRLEIRNMRKVRQADIEFHGPGLQIIQGLNQSGKTTVAQCIAITLDGPSSFTPGMITRGEEQAEIVAYTDDGLQIRTAIRDTPRQSVCRMDETAGRYVAVSGGVRAFLNSVRSGLEMPWSLRDMTDARIIGILKDRTGTTAAIEGIDAAIKEKEAARAETGRDKKKLGTRNPVAAAEQPPPIDDIQAERERAANYVKSVRDEFLRVSDGIRGRCNFQSVRDMRDLAGVIEENAVRIEAALKERKSYTDEDVAMLDRRIAAWVEADREARACRDYLEWKGEFEDLTARYETLTREIETLREWRRKTLSGMDLKVKGLEISEENTLIHNGAARGITETNRVGNWSAAESVQVFFSIGARFAGAMKVLVVDNAESLDGATTGAISRWAEQNSFLVILLKVAGVPEELEEGIIYLKEGDVLTA
jgi:DNA repair exonuclease SbcCD ATPase subunit